MRDNEDDLVIWKWGQLQGQRYATAAKAGRGGQSMSTQYAAVYAAMTTKPSSADAAIQATWLDGMVAGGYFAKAELLDMFSTPIADSSLINWKSPGTFDPTVVNAPAFVAYSGYTGATGKYGRTNFIPSTNGTLIGLNSVTLIVGCGTDAANDAMIAGVRDSGSARLFVGPESSAGNFTYTANNASQYTTPNTNGKGHFTVARKTLWLEAYINTTQVTTNVGADAVCARELFFCAYNLNGTASIVANQQIRYLFLFSYLTAAEVAGVVTLTEAYLDNYSTGLI